MNDKRVVLDSSKVLNAFDELQGKLQKMVGLHEELAQTFNTAYANDNITFYSRIEKLTLKFKETIEETVKPVANLKQQVLEHADRMKKFSEEC